jgi:hypothetical protein
MKKNYLLLITIILFTSACAVKIPMQANLSEQTMLMAKNKNIKADYVLASNVLDGPIAWATVQKNGREYVSKAEYEYDSETAFNKIWNAYFSSKFNSLADETVEIDVLLVDLYLLRISSTSIGENIITGNSRYSIEAIAVLEFTVNYKGKTHTETFEINASDYNESRPIQQDGVYQRESLENPTRQKSDLLESCLNRSVIQFENFINSIVLDGN